MEDKRKGFTLIELLAIIVILAIIAVITVPLILDVIEDLKKKAATDSAYGYKDAVNKYYMAKVLYEDDYNIPDGIYTVNETTGYLEGNEILSIKISGKKSSSGTVEISQNEIKQGCLQFGDYAVSIINNEISETKKSNCDGYEISDSATAEIQN